MRGQAELPILEPREPGRVDSLSGAEVLPTGIEAAVQGDPLWSRRLAAIILISLTAVFLISVIYDPGDHNPYGTYSTICVFKNVTTLPCPGCGLSHSFCEIGKGNLTSAVTWNWLGIPAFFFAVLAWLKSIFILTGWERPALAFDRVARRVRPVRLFAIAFVLYGIGRIVYILFFLRPAQAGTSLYRAMSWLLA
jgi:hypothetical protein